MRTPDHIRSPGGALVASDARGVLAAVLLAVACTRPAAPGPGADSAIYADDRPDLEVAVTDAEGAPVVGAWAAADPSGREAQADADGVASFLDLGAGDYALTVGAEGYALADATVTVDADVSISVTLTAEAARSTTLAGTIWGPDGSALEGAAVYVDDAEVATTDADGGFEATELSAGDVEVRVEAEGLVDWTSPALTLTDGARTEIGARLAALTPEDAELTGSESCEACHTDVAADYADSAHGTEARDPATLEATGDLADLTASFVAGDVLDIEELGATVTLSRDGSGWWAEVADAEGHSSGALPVLYVYGGARMGAALTVQAGGTEALLPVTWALAGQGLSSQQDEAGWVSGWTDGWFDASGALDLDSSGKPGSDASFALKCAGCHTTVTTLSESGGAWTATAPSGTLERRVGCESCHGAGSTHADSSEALRAWTIENPALFQPSARIEVCARCHEQTTASDHPFSATPGWPVTSAGDQLAPTDAVYDYASSNPTRWLEATASRVGWDEAGDLRISPHRSGEQGYEGACEDCHDPHGGPHAGSLRVEPGDNTLCTTCHVATFPDDASQASHAHHWEFAPDLWGQGSCVGCHFPRMGLVVRPDAVSGAGEVRAHTLDFITPDAALAEFDAAGASELDGGLVPVGACLDCHLQNNAAMKDEGSACPCPNSDPRKRSTYVDLQGIYDALWGAQ